MVMHGDILPAIPIVTPIYAVTAPKWRHLPAIPMLWPHLPAMLRHLCYYHADIYLLLRPISCSQNELYSVYSKKSRLSMKKMN